MSAGINKLAIVTGATGGIGAAVTARLLAEGYGIIALGHTPHKVAALDGWIVSLDGDRGQALAIDVTMKEDWERVDVTIEHYQSMGLIFTLLVVCHGHAPVPGPAPNALQDVQDVLQCDVIGALLACQVAGTYMLAQRHGNIVLVSSLHARQTYPARVAYVASKAAVCGLGRALAVEWGLYNVRVNMLLPWQVSGDRSQRLMETSQAQGYDLEEAYRQRSPMRRLIQPEEVADAVLFLARNEAMNGCELVMDGGVSSSMWFKPFTEPSHAQSSTLSQP